MQFTQKFIKEYAKRQAQCADSLPDELRDIAESIRNDTTPATMRYMEQLKSSTDPMSSLLWTIIQQLDELNENSPS
jgi:hypothetical protein